MLSLSNDTLEHSLSGQGNKKIHGNSRDDIDSSYVSSKRGRGLASTEDCVNTNIRHLEDNLKKSEGILNTATRSKTQNIIINKATITKN